MSRIRGKNTTPEKVVRSLLHRMGYRFRLHVRIPIIQPQRRGDAERNVLKSRRGIQSSLSASTGERAGVRCRIPRVVSVDVLLPKYQTAIFVHGCFWHRHKGCKNCTTPTNRRAWWLAKLNGNAARDKRHQRALRKLGWCSIVVWECQTEKINSLEKLGRRIENILKQRSDHSKATASSA